MRCLAWLGLLTIISCASPSLTPKSEEVEASRKAPKSSCEEVSRVSGNTTSAKGTAADALEDMKREAAMKGANYVQIGEYSGTGTSVTGLAFKCH